MTDIVPHTLAGNPALFCNFGEGEILVIIEAETFPLLVG